MNYSNELRPVKLGDLIGQKKVIDRLKISIKSCQQRGECLPHVFLSGFSGSGKTTIGLAIANELNTPIQIINCAAISDVKSILPFLIKITANSIIFLDEMQALPKTVANLLLSVIESGKLNLGKSGHVMAVEIPQSTFIAATTNPGSILETIKNRFLLQYQLQPYTQTELCEIIKKSASKLNLIIDDTASMKLVCISKSNPRLVNHSLLFTRDWAAVNNLSNIDISTIDEIMVLLDIDKDYLDANDRLYLATVKKHQPVGVRTLVSLTNLSSDTITEIIEPELLRRNWIVKTKKGRKLV